MDTSRIQVLIICVAALLLVGVIELVRRRRLLERYALLWLLSSVVLLGLAIWRGALDRIAQEVGVAYPPNALFIVAFGFVLWMLLHFSVAVSRLSDQSKVLAQRLALLEERLRRQEEITAGEDDEALELAEVGPARREHVFRRAGKP
jgi:hypothetical protein